MHRAHIPTSIVVTATFLAALSARAQIDCAQCQAVCASRGSSSAAYPDDLKPEALSAQIKHNNPDARAEFLEAQKRDPSFGGNDLTGAVASYKKAVLLDDKNSQYRNYLAAALLANGAPGEAVYNLQAAVRLVPSEAKYLVNLGYAYHRAGDETRALVHYMRGLMLDPRDLRARLFAAFAFEQLGLVEDAVLELKRVLAQEPKHEVAKRALARLAPPPLQSK
jgi:tetratricopeptide (TPR) repeat protein